MNLQKYIICVFLIYWNLSFGCDCAPQKKEVMVENGLAQSDIVFYGQVIKLDSINETYTFRIIELFKGKYTSTTINGKTSGGNCSILPQLNDIWIVYSDIDDQNTIDISMCSASQTMYNGFGYYPPPPSPAITDNPNPEIKELMYKIHDLEHQNKSLSLWIYQLEKLRHYKSMASITMKAKPHWNYKIMIGSLVANMILLLTIISIIVSKKNAK